jgi:hypothetical protein
MNNWPERLFDLIYIPNMDDKLDELVELAETESWDYQNTIDTHRHPILFNYLQYTYSRLASENKVVISDNGQSITFNTGLVTDNQEPIFAFANSNRNITQTAPWYFQGWRRRGDYEMTKFSDLPEMAHYFDDPSALVFDPRKELRSNIEHIITDNKERFPEPYKSMGDYALQTFLKGALDNAQERIKRNYKTAIPHFYRGKVQLLLPLCLGSPNKADLAIVAEDHGSFYRVSTCITLDMAYNNARQLARPDRDWLLP